MEENIDVIEVSMSEQEIDDVIASLRKLKIEKESVQVPIASDVDLLVNYHQGDADDEEDFEEDDDGDGII